jgi:hypothetical protein
VHRQVRRPLDGQRRPAVLTSAPGHPKGQVNDLPLWGRAERPADFGGRLVGFGTTAGQDRRTRSTASRISSVTKPERSSERKVVYYSGLLAWLGCHTDAYEQAKWFGDDLAVKADGFIVADRTGVDAEPSWSRRPPLERASLGIAFVGAVRRGAVIDVRRSLRDSYER